MIAPQYRAQVDLLLRVLPYVAKEGCFALKGGTAINLMVRDLPRLSVDIDLTYLPFEDRDTALAGIRDGLNRIQATLQAGVPEITINTVTQSDGVEAKLTCQLHRAQIKIEVNTIMRGHIEPIRMMPVRDIVQDEFGKFAAMNVISHSELYGGKICAALDRQHPRDLFDIKLLMENEGLTKDLSTGFIAALLSSPRPINELLRPNPQDQRAAYDRQFSGMSEHPFTYNDFETIRAELFDQVTGILTKKDKELLISFKQGEPNWSLAPGERIKELPAVRWKLKNIQKLKANASAKHVEMVEALSGALK